jgi:type I restriction enzyme, S subunit
VSWPKVPIRHLATVVTRGSAPNYSESSTGYDAQVVGQSCLRPDGSIDLGRARGHAGPVPEKGRVFGGEVLINSTGTGTLGRAALLPVLESGPAFVDGHVTLIRVAPDRCDARFLAYALGLPAFVTLAEEALSVGSTKQRELNVDAVRRHAVHAPSIAAQRAVADFLDRECQRIAEAVAGADRMVAAALPPALELAKAEFDRQPLGRIGYRFSVQLGKKLYEDRVVHETAVPYLRNANVHWDELKLDDLKVMNFDARERELYALEHGDLLVCEGGEPGRSAVWSGEISDCYFQMALNRVRPYANDSTRYLMWALRVLSNRNAFAVDGPGRYTHLTAEMLRAVRVPMPEVAVQHERLAEIDAAASRGRRLAEIATRIRARLTEYREALITESVTGQLDVTAVSDAQMEERAQAVAEGVVAVDRSPAGVG